MRNRKKSPTPPTGIEPCRVVVVGDTIISEQGLVAIISRDPRYHVCGAAHTFEEANKLVRQHRPDVLLIEPFLENRDAIRWIKDLAAEFRRRWGKCQFGSSECNAAKRYAHSTSTSNKLEHELEQAPENRSTLGPVHHPGVTSKGVYRRLMDGGTYPTSPTYTINANASFRDSQVSRGGYCYEVTAINANGQSGPSNESCATTK